MKSPSPILQDSVRREGVRGYGEYNSWNSREQQLDTRCFVGEEIGVFQACAVVNVKTGGMFLRITQNGESVQLLSGACGALVR